MKTLARRSDIRLLATLVCASALLHIMPARAVAANDVSPDLSALERIEVEPQQLRLSSPRDEAIFLVTGIFPENRVADVTRVANVTSANSAVAEFRDGAVRPAGNGACELTVQIDKHQVVVPVVVDGFDQPAPVSFRKETVAALTRQGCNAGACHGSPSGKGGFQLSLQAYDHALDENSLARGEEGRRTNAVDPAQSLLLLKPTMAVAHRGGLQLRTTDYAYDVLRQWIAEGCRVDAAEGARCVRLEILPATGRVLMQPHWRQQLVARAHFDDGRVQDVTRLTRFSSSDEQIASVEEGGAVVGLRRGQVAVMARYLDQLVSSQFTMVEEIDGFHWSDPPANNYVDERVYEKLRQLQYEPSPLCSDTDFVRRVYLDVIGRLPTIDEQDAFFADSSHDRRRQLIDRLLERPEYARFWALKWADLLRLQRSDLKEAGVHKFYNWLVDSFAKNTPLNEFARDLLTAQGSTYAHPAANYYRAFDEPTEAAETTAQLFLGSRIQCAKCHNHPFENWTQDNFYGLSAFFSRVGRKPGLRVEEEIVYVKRDGEVRQPRTGQLMEPWLPVAGVLHDATMGDRRAALADWLTKPENPFFARVMVNRIWAEIMGRGIVHPVDDFRQSNPPSIPALLDKLAEDFAAQGYDQKHILRTILNSRTYQLTSEATELNKDDTRFFSHAQMRMLRAEQLLDAVCQVTGIEESFAGLPPGTRATEVPSPDFGNEFLDTFGRPARTTACACERGTDSTLAQVIELFNGSLVQRKLADKQNRFHRLLAEGCRPQEVIEQLYRSAVCRKPTDAEVQAAADHIAAKDNPADGLEDVCWALVNGNEFLTQH
ncbi:MAG TPA: DUF1549 and DUF1553 domain-containing protein [Lacipirellulaceae bacterium]|nr:DUF1549 and DUF1553 domain-containing protein [Lacipirellulaceae bacterium]